MEVCLDTVAAEAVRTEVGTRAGSLHRRHSFADHPRTPQEGGPKAQGSHLVSSQTVPKLAAQLATMICTSTNLRAVRLDDLVLVA